MDPILLIVLVAVIVVALVGAALVVRSRRPTRPEPVRPRTATTAPPAPSLRSRLSKTRSALAGRLGDLFGTGELDAAFWESLEEALIGADVGVATATALIERVRADRPGDGVEARTALEDELVRILQGRARELELAGNPAVVLVVGVNGTGKTTSIAKLAARIEKDGHRVVLAAGDTFRAAAEDQLRTWADRVGVEVVGRGEGADPAAVAFDAYRRAMEGGFDVLIVDTAGRLHSKTNLMDELDKVARVLRREAGAIAEVLLVLDGTTGQNGIAQARSFTGRVGVTGLVLTKLDGTSRGGVAIAVEQELDIPVKFIGVGEGIEDLVPFDPREFTEALLEP